MTRPDLDALEALAAKATPGPWRVGIKHGHYVCETDDWITAECGSITRPGAYADNVALIVAAVNALPALIARVRELERERDAAALRALDSPWLDAEAAAAYLRYETRTFREKIAVQPGFPEPRYFGGVTPRWKRSEIDAWADEQPRQRQPRRSATPAMSGE